MTTTDEQQAYYLRWC